MKPQTHYNGMLFSIVVFVGMGAFTAVCLSVPIRAYWKQSNMNLSTMAMDKKTTKTTNIEIFTQRTKRYVDSPKKTTTQWVHTPHKGAKYV